MPTTITFNELRKIKDQLSHGSVQQIADELNIAPDMVRNYFGGDHYEGGQCPGFHLEPGPDGGIVRLDDCTILDKARELLSRQQEA
ncbi:MAG: DNA-binding protein [Bacteroidales bacterium]|jgi:hypothetical protein|nr:DNA-binding protein [Bacteroidales bacterium]MBR5250199.1 DNA-binding protein [Bacteroidales bacterium]